MTIAANCSLFRGRNTTIRSIQPLRHSIIFLRPCARYRFTTSSMPMSGLPQHEVEDERSEIQGTPYESDRWIMARLAEFVVHTNSVETARQFYRPILELDPAARYWVRDFMHSWILQGLQVSPDLQGFSQIWQDMVVYTETLPAWQPG